MKGIQKIIRRKNELKKKEKKYRKNPPQENHQNKHISETVTKKIRITIKTNSQYNNKVMKIKNQSKRNR